MYVKVKNASVDAFPYSIGQLRKDNPHVSFPSDITDELLAEFDVFPVLTTEKPDHNKATHRVVEEAPLKDADGNWRQSWGVVPLSGAELASNAVEARAVAKAERQVAVDTIVVTTTTGKAFDGDETSQTRMARAIVALQATGTPSISWILANNTVTEATIAELSEALALAGAEQARLWVAV